MNPCQRHALPLFLCVVLLAPSLATAQVVLDLGADSSNSSLVVFFSNGLAETPLDGRELTMTLTFAEEKTVEMISGNEEGNTYYINLAFNGTHDSGAVGGPDFSGWIEDRIGTRVDGTINARGAGGNLFGYELSFESTELAVEISRIQFTVTLPTVEGATLINNSFVAFTPNEGGQVVVDGQSVSTENLSFGAMKARRQR